MIWLDLKGHTFRVSLGVLRQKRDEKQKQKQDYKYPCMPHKESGFNLGCMGFYNIDLDFRNVTVVTERNLESCYWNKAEREKFYNTGEKWWTNKMVIRWKGQNLNWGRGKGKQAEEHFISRPSLGDV